MKGFQLNLIHGNLLFRFTIMQRTRRTLASKSRCYCSVFGCSNYITPQISLHKFPPDSKMRKKWSDVLQMTKPVGKGMRVCSEHFAKSDFFISKCGFPLYLVFKCCGFSDRKLSETTLKTLCCSKPEAPRGRWMGD